MITLASFVNGGLVTCFGLTNSDIDTLREGRLIDISCNTFKLGDDKDKVCLYYSPKCKFEKDDFRKKHIKIAIAIDDEIISCIKKGKLFQKPARFDKTDISVILFYGTSEESIMSDIKNSGLINDKTTIHTDDR